MWEYELHRRRAAEWERIAREHRRALTLRRRRRARRATREATVDWTTAA